MLGSLHYWARKHRRVQLEMYNGDGRRILASRPTRMRPAECCEGELLLDLDGSTDERTIAGVQIGAEDREKFFNSVICVRSGAFAAAALTWAHPEHVMRADRRASSMSFACLPTASTSRVALLMATIQ